MRIGLTLLDVDGTLLDSDLRLTERTRSTINECAASGVKFALVSGRPLASLRALTVGLEGVRFLISGNGSVLLDLESQRIKVKEAFEGDLLERLVKFGLSRSFGICLHAEDGWYACGVRGQVDVEIARSGSLPVSYLDNEADRASDFGRDILKILFVGPPDVIQQSKRELEEAESDVRAMVSYPEYLEAMPIGVTKAGFIEEIRECLGSPRAEILAIGDGENDVEMLGAADVAVCVANASYVARACAQYEVPSNDEDGVAVALDAFLLNRPSAWIKVRSLA